MQFIKEHGRKILFCILAAVFAVSMTVIVKKQLDYSNGAKEYAAAQEEAGLVLPETVTAAQAASSTAAASSEAAEPEKTQEEIIVEALKAMDFDALKEKNSDVIGWILIPDTEINYPILYGSNNDYYLSHTWNNEYNSVGAIFMDSRLSGDFTDFNTIIYGHRMRDGSMFGGLKYYSDQSYWQQHPRVYIALATGEIYRYDIFAAYEASVEGKALQRTFDTEDAKQKLISSGLSRTAVDTGIVPETTDSILTLSTCTGQGYSTRWVVQAVRRQIEQSAE